MRSKRALRWVPAVLIVGFTAYFFLRSSTVSTGDESTVRVEGSVRRDRGSMPTDVGRAGESTSTERGESLATGGSPATGEDPDDGEPGSDEIEGIARRDGQLLPDSVIQYGWFSSGQAVVTTDAEGRFTIRRRGDLRFWIPGCSEVRRDILPGATSISLEFASYRPGPGVLRITDSVGRRVAGARIGDRRSSASGLIDVSDDRFLRYWRFDPRGRLGAGGIEVSLDDEGVALPGAGVTFTVVSPASEPVSGARRFEWTLVVRAAGEGRWNPPVRSSVERLTILHECEGSFEYRWSTKWGSAHGTYEVGPSGVDEVLVCPYEVRSLRVRFIDRWNHPVDRVEILPSDATEFAAPGRPPIRGFPNRRVDVAERRSVLADLCSESWDADDFVLTIRDPEEVLLLYSIQGCSMLRAETLRSGPVRLDGPAFVGVIEADSVDRVVLSSDEARTCRLNGEGQYCIPYSGDPTGVVLEVFRGDELVHRTAGRIGEYQRIRF